jgi:hypothetical protein
MQFLVQTLRCASCAGCLVANNFESKVSDVRLPIDRVSANAQLFGYIHGAYDHLLHLVSLPSSPNMSEWRSIKYEIIG